jgi:hypothetical protein
MNLAARPHTPSVPSLPVSQTTVTQQQQQPPPVYLLKTQKLAVHPSQHLQQHTYLKATTSTFVFHPSDYPQQITVAEAVPVTIASNHAPRQMIPAYQTMSRLLSVPPLKAMQRFHVLQIVPAVLDIPPSTRLQHFEISQAVPVEIALPLLQPVHNGECSLTPDSTFLLTAFP